MGGRGFTIGFYLVTILKGICVENGQTRIFHLFITFSVLPLLYLHTLLDLIETENGFHPSYPMAWVYEKVYSIYI